VFAASVAAKLAANSSDEEAAVPGNSEGDTGGAPAEAADGGDAVNPAKEKAPFFRTGGAMPVPKGEAGWGATGASDAAEASPAASPGRAEAVGTGALVTWAGSTGAASCAGGASVTVDPPETGLSLGGRGAVSKLGDSSTLPIGVASKPETTGGTSGADD
jgi:hypothetical protein